MTESTSRDCLKEPPTIEIIENANSQELSEKFTGLLQQGYAALMPTIRVSNSLPKGEQRDIFRASPLFNPIMDTLGNKTLDLMSLILQHQGMYRDIKKRDVEEKTELIIDANDKILERVNTYLDELSGIRRNPSQPVIDGPVPVPAASGSWNRDVSKSAAWKEIKLTKNSPNPVVLKIGNITRRPQLNFQDKIDNSSTPFEPRIKEKPHALKPLAILYEALVNEDPCYSHPYEFELERFQEKIESLDLFPRKPQNPKPIEDTPLIMITKEDQLMEMVEELCPEKVIAVDLEHHSYRSFQGFTCLMQISTREKDYIIDTLELRHKLYVLNKVFTDPKIVKVFHGADCDIQWLQRDLCLYVVNMFDTYQAALLLSLPRLSLAFLLKSICNIEANKHFQLYDWRTRPLAKDAIKYAREDTHYLLYIYDVLFNRLIEKSNGGTQMLQSAIFRSTDTCKRRYWKFIFKDDSYENMYRQSKKNFDNRQMYALKELYAWRDRTAREEDESTGFVLPNHMLLLIAEQLPKEVQGILACCNPIPSLVRQNVVLLHQIILKAREQPLVVRLSTGSNSEARVRPAQQTSVNMEGALHCPHDLTHNEDFRDDMPTLLNSVSNTQPEADVNMDLGIDLMEVKPGLSVFGDVEENEDCNLSRMSIPTQIHFMSPFERYKKMLTYLEHEETKSKEDRENKSKEDREREIARDTQNLLDQCLHDRLEAASSSTEFGNTSVEMLDIKQEDQVHSRNPRKRFRSQDSYCDEGASIIDHDIKIENVIKKPNHKRKKYKNVYEEFKAKVLSSTPTSTNDADECPPEREWKRGSNTGLSILPMGVGRKKRSKHTPQNMNKKNSSEGFSQYDYSNVDYSEYQFTNIGHTPKAVPDRFKHKGKKKQQNKSFTFAREYGGGNK